jgi:hypothetical protein
MGASFLKPAVWTLLRLLAMRSNILLSCLKAPNVAEDPILRIFQALSLFLENAGNVPNRDSFLEKKLSFIL